jgi:hypothetical protein
LNQEWVYQYPVDTFVDSNNDVITITLQNKPTWLNFDANTRIFRGTPTLPNTVELTITGDDGWNGTVSDTFKIVTGRGFPNTPPVILNDIPTQKAYVYKMF